MSAKARLNERVVTHLVKDSSHGQKLANHSISIARSNMAYTIGQTWGALRKTWKAYRIAKVQNNSIDMRKYAERIRSLQAELGVAQASFPDLNLV